MANKLFKSKRVTSDQIRTTYDLLDELLNKGLVNKKKLVKDSVTMDSGNIFESVDNRFSISLDGLTHLKSSSPKTAKATATAIVTTIKKIFIGVAVGLLVWWLTTQSGIF
ncbi:hypothetical protein [Fulvivirga marina]|uniref:hypothetical protein n=1 Tax=Fulvivirga marina TaxID=2494733 RepID=UPI00192E0429|nr:hypothetical protein [Fulvivirga marina]